MTIFIRVACTVIAHAPPEVLARSDNPFPARGGTSGPVGGSAVIPHVRIIVGF